jgi:tol-pal system protein YbgF
MRSTLRALLRGACAAVCVAAAASAHAALFEDDEARRAILDLRQKVEQLRQDHDGAGQRSSDEGATLRRSLLDLQNQIEALRAEVAALRGINEQLGRELAEVQRRQKDVAASLDERLRGLEPQKTQADGRDFLVEPGERRAYDAALVLLRKGDFVAAQQAFIDFVRRWAGSGYEPSALFWLGNAQYATRDYKEAILNFRALVTRDPQHLRAPEALLSIAKCQVELKDAKSARKTLDELVKTYPDSEAAATAKERLARLK